MDIIENRYMPDHPLKVMPNGQLIRGMDLTLNREVLLYTFQETDESAPQDALRWLGKASRLSDENFMNILDVGSDKGMLFAVLQVETGGPLSDKLRDLEIKGLQALKYVHELAKAIREARRNRLLECSVDAENLWIDDKGRLRIMNYWMEGKNGRRGVPGLALLLYQLSAKTDIPTSSMRAYTYEMNRLFSDLPDAARERAVALACNAYEGICTLAGFQQELELLLRIGDERKEPLLTPASPANNMMVSSGRNWRSAGREPRSSVEPKKEESKAEGGTAEGRKPEERQMRINAAADRTTAEPRKLFRESFQLRKWHLFATAGTGLLVLLLWLTMRPHPEQVNGSTPQTIPTPDPTTVSMNSVETPKPSASVSEKEALKAAPTAKPVDAKAQEGTKTQEDAKAQSADDGTVLSKAGVVPDLVGHTREAAEKMAIDSGLRYQFFMESNTTSKGLVFKQDLAPGTAIKKGDRITFWVSKGS